MSRTREGVRYVQVGGARWEGQVGGPGGRGQVVGGRNYKLIRNYKHANQKIKLKLNIYLRHDLESS